MKRVKKVLFVLGGFALVVVVCLFIAKAQWDEHFLDGYNQAAPLNVTMRGEENRTGYLRIDFAFDGTPGMAVPTLLALPSDAKAPYPCIIFLHGIGQDKDFLDDIASRYTSAGFAITSFDQYTRGERKLKNSSTLDGIFAMRRRAALNVIETRRLVDYLQTRKDIAPDRIYLVGASYGAITGSTAAAFEPRLAAAVITYGGGNLSLLFNSAASKQQLGKWHLPLSMLMEYVMAPGDPIRYVAKISPRPTLFQNGSHDQIVPPESGKALYDAAGEPKKFVMYDSDHVGLDVANTVKVLDDSIAWLKEIDSKRSKTAATSSESAISLSAATAAAS